MCHLPANSNLTQSLLYKVTVMIFKQTKIIESIFRIFLRNSPVCNIAITIILKLSRIMSIFLYQYKKIIVLMKKINTQLK